MSGAAGKLRVLVLHGYASNPLAYARRVSALTKACSSVADFVFAPAPHQVRSLPSETNPEPGPVDPSLPLEKQARAWFMANDETGVYEGRTRRGSSGTTSGNTAPLTGSSGSARGPA